MVRKMVDHADIAAFLWLMSRDWNFDKVSENIDSVVLWMNMQLAVLVKGITVQKATVLEFRQILQNMGAGPVTSATFQLTETAGRDPRTKKNTLDFVKTRSEKFKNWAKIFAGK